MNYDDLAAAEKAQQEIDDLAGTGLAYLYLRRAAQKALSRLEVVYNDPDVDSLTRSDVLNVILVLREALEG